MKSSKGMYINWIVIFFSGILNLIEINIETTDILCRFFQCDSVVFAEKFGISYTEIISWASEKNFENLLKFLSKF